MADPGVALLERDDDHATHPPDLAEGAILTAAVFINDVWGRDGDAY